MTLEDIASAKRLALGAVLLYVLWLLANSAFSFAYQLKRQHEQQQATLRTLERDNERQTAMLREGLERQRADLAKPRTVTRTSTKKSTRQKLTAAALVNRLRQVNAFGLVANPERRLHCTESRGGWDYTCRFHPDPITTTTWTQFGVLVDSAHVIEMSKLYPSDTSLPGPLSLAAK
jgi:hypothetical protein